VKRVFTTRRPSSVSSELIPPLLFALRFAAKEAFSKAIGLGMRRGIRWRDIESSTILEVGLALDFRPILRNLPRKQITRFHLSLSDEGRYGMAVVVLEGNDATG